eukprot:1533308-Pyramimonas_sp.AAC.1
MRRGSRVWSSEDADGASTLTTDRESRCTVRICKRGGEIRSLSQPHHQPSKSSFLARGARGSKPTSYALDWIRRWDFASMSGIF